MSVPLPSPSPLTSAKPIPRSRPAPISTAEPGSQGASPSSSSFRRPGYNTVARSAGFSMTDDNWRATREPKTASAVESEANGGNGTNGSGSGQGKGPERTVGGFEKKELRSPPSLSGIAGARDKAAQPTADSKTAALSHVPCRFFKAGACTAGSSCPFSHDMGGKKEICQWFLKGDCKFGHKCALAHVRPGEPMSMDRKNKKEQQREARERAEGKPGSLDESSAVAPPPLVAPISPATTPTAITHPVPIRSSGSVLSSSLQQGSLHSPGRGASSPLREPYGPPAAAVGSPSAGFNRPSAGFASSPSRPSPLSGSFGTRGTISGPMSLKAGATVAHSPLRPPPSADAVFSSSFSHAPPIARDAMPLSASFADGNARARSIWAARSPALADQLSPGRAIHKHRMIDDDVFDDDLDDHGEDLLPSSLSDLLTPTERARRMSRRDSNESFGRSPTSRQPFAQYWLGTERLAQSAGAALPPGYLQGLWNDNGADARRDTSTPESNGAGPRSAVEASAELTFTAGPPQPPRRQSLLTQRAPTSPFVPIRDSAVPASPPTNVDPSYLYRGVDPSSPNARALQEHAPGQSLPGGLAAALSRIHMQPQAHLPSVLRESTSGSGTAGVPVKGREMELASPPGNAHVLPGRRDEHEDEGVFQMDG